MTNPTAEEIVKQAQSGNTGTVKTLTDLKLEEFNKRLADLETRNAELLRLNEELRASNAELYSFAAQVSRQAEQPAVQTAPQAQPAAVYAAQVQVSPEQQKAQAMQKAKEDKQVNDVLIEMGYARPNADTPNDGM